MMDPTNPINRINTFVDESQPEWSYSYTQINPFILQGLEILKVFKGTLTQQSKSTCRVIQTENKTKKNNDEMVAL